VFSAKKYNKKWLKIARGGIMKKFLSFCSFVLVLFLVGCLASVEMSTVKTKDDYKNVWNACLDSLPDIQFAASSVDSASGLIIAEKSIGRAALRLNIRVEKSSYETVVVVKFIPPSGALVGQGTAEKYVAALKKRIPDLQVSVK
jgi:hypothetical protein